MTFDMLLVAVSVLILWKAAAWFVEGAVGVAVLLRVPKMLIGLVLVSLATTSPELFTSLIAALKGYPELALGNAMGSVTVNATLALGLAAMLAAVPLTVDPAIFRISAGAVLLAIPLAFVLVMNGTLGRIEGGGLLAFYLGYAVFLYMELRSRRKNADFEALLAAEGIPADRAGVKWSRVFLHFGIGLIGVLFGSELLVRGAMSIATHVGLSPVVIGLTVTAIGTSMPEIATCVTSALKRESAIGVGNIIGADILNVCWVAGMSAVANPLQAEQHVLWFMFPAAFIIVGTMVGMIRRGHQLNRWNGAVLVGMYIVYAVILFTLISPPQGS